MSSLTISGIGFACNFGGTLLGMVLPFDGMIQISSDPLRRALAQLGR